MLLLFHLNDCFILASSYNSCQDNNFNIFRYAFAFQIDSPYIELFNREMLIMQERGMIKDLWQKFVKGKFLQLTQLLSWLLFRQIFVHFH